MCPRSPESQPYQGLHQNKRVQQGEGYDPAPVLGAGEASPGVLRPDAESSVQERQGPVRVCPEEGHTNSARNGQSELGLP